MSPVLAQAASDLHVSTAAAGQLRTITGLAAGITALTLGAVAGRIGLGRQLLLASGLLALASVGSAAAPSFAAVGGQPAAGRRRRCRADDGGHTGYGRVGGAGAEDASALLGTRGPACSLDRRHAADRASGRAELALRMARTTACRRRRSRNPRRARAPGSRLPAHGPRVLAPRSPTVLLRAGWRPSCSRTPPGRERSSTQARSSPSRTARPPSSPAACSPSRPAPTSPAT